MFSDSALIIAAGMPRSASTWLYNAARLLLSSSPSISQQFSCGWIGDWENIPKKKYMLIKVHRYNESLVDQSKCILYSYRDIRDALASSFRKFGQVPSIEAADALVSQYEKWMNVANVVMRYESMLDDKESIITQLVHLFGMQNIDPARIVENIERISYQSQGSKNATYHNVNLYHRGHMTDGRHGSWKGLIDSNLLKQIEEKHQEWFEKCGYRIRYLSIESIQANALNQQGEDLFVKGDIEGALNAFTKAIEVNSDLAAPHNNLGVLFWQKGQIENAVKHFVKALEIEPLNRNTILNCADVFKSLQRFEGARQIYSSYLKRNPDDTEIKSALLQLQPEHKASQEIYRLTEETKPDAQRPSAEAAACSSKSAQATTNPLGET